VKLDAEETIVTAFAESAAGPGWGNSPVWVVVRARDHALRLECLQPDEQNREIRVLYGVSAATHAAMTKQVESLLREKRKVRP
jgi:hypothetical protein